MESLKNLANSILESIGREQFVRIAAIYALIVGMFGLCFAPLMAAVGGLAFLGGMAADAGTRMGRGVDAQADAELGAALSALFGAGTLAGGVAILSLATGIALIIVSIGLFRRAGWARTGFIIIGALDVVVSLLLLTSGFDVLQLISIVITAFVIFIFTTDEGVKRLFTERKANAR